MFNIQFAICSLQFPLFRSPRARRWGIISVLALILLSSLLTVALCAGSEAGLDLKIAQNLAATEQAYQHALSGLDGAFYLAKNSSTWRQQFATGPPILYVLFLGGTVTVAGVDQDGDFGDDPTDPVEFTVTGAYQGARRVLKVTGIPPVHETATYAGCSTKNGKGIKLSDSIQIYGDIRANDNVTTSGGLPDVHGDIYTREGKSIAAALDDGDTEFKYLPGDARLPPVDFGWYQARGERITAPPDGSHLLLADVVISPTANPYGFTDAEGVYFIDAGDKELWIRNVRFTGTLVVRNSRKVKWFEGCWHQTFNSNYPAILVDEATEFDLSKNLSEVERGVDYNGDGDQNDTFVSKITGLIYATKKLVGFQSSTSNIVYITGAVVGEELELKGPGVRLIQDAALATDLVPGFHGTGLVPVPGTAQEQY